MNFWVYALTMLATVGFYNYHNMFSMVAQRAAFYALTVIALTLALTERNSSLRKVEYPRISYWALLIFISISALMANIFHHQPLSTCIIATIPYLFGYLWFYILIRLKIPTKIILKFLFINVCIGSVVFFINIATFPNNIFGAPILEDLSRGIQRIPIEFGDFLQLFVFYGIYKYKATNKKKYIFLIVGSFIMIIMSLIRQTILLTAILGLWYLMKNISIRRKIAFFIIIASMSIIIIPRIPFYNDIMDLTEKQLDNNDSDDDIRIQAWQYYTYENWDNVATMLLGNGIPSIGKSKYGNLFEANANATKCIAEDVGWAGFSFYFGIVSSIFLMIFLFKSIIRNNRPDKQYLTYWILQTIITSVASAPILYFSSITHICIVLYMAYSSDLPDNNSTNIPTGPI